MSSGFVRVVALIGALAACGLTAVNAAPDDGWSIGIWPVGLATGCLLIAPRRVHGLLLLVIGAIALATIAVGRPVDVAAGYGLGIVAETWVVRRILVGPVGGRPSLRTDAEVERYFIAVFAGGLVAATAGALTSVITGWGDAGTIGLALGLSHLASQAVIVPLFSLLPDHPGLAGMRERVAMWLLIVLLTPAVFVPDGVPSVEFVVIPLLAWAARRMAPWEALLQMLLLLGIVILLTSLGHGPIAGVPEVYGLSSDARGIVLATFTVVCAVVVVPIVLGVGIEIESGRQAEAERDRLENVVNNTPGVAIIGTDPFGRITLFNPGAERLLGYSAEEVMGSHTHAFHRPSDISRLAAELGVEDSLAEVALAISAPEVGQVEIGFVRKDGEERRHLLTLSRIEDGRGRVVGYVSTSEDITERLAAENALKEALERMREVDTVKDAFVSSVSHELRTPITSIVGYLELLKDGDFGKLNDSQVDAISRVAANSGRLLGLIDDLLTLSRVQEHGLGGAQQAFDLREVVQSGTGVVMPVLATRDLDITVDVPAEPVPLVGDKDMVERAVVNLVSNAVKFTPDGGRVEVRLRAGEGYALLRVSDSGIGIPLGEQANLFSRFFRSALAQQQAIPGSGLGLSITRGIVENHGGSIEVESAEGEGTTFHVRLPVVT